jgi:predicted tellurium resistance membrane protein TerC
MAALVVLTMASSSAEAFQTTSYTRLASSWGISQQPPALLLTEKKPHGLRLLRDPRVESGDSIPRMALDSASNSGKTPEATDIATALENATDQETRIYQSAILRTLGWVGAATLFGAFLLVTFGPETSEEFFAGYLVEQSLSVDNLFVFLLLFEYFKVPLESQDRVLNWGIFGAIVMRATMIGLGAAALQNFHEILLVFAGILVYSSVKVIFSVEEDDDEEDPSENAIVKFSQNLISSTQLFDGDRFFTLVDGVKMATPLFICMIAVEISDVVFAIDSIPAVFGVTEVHIALPMELVCYFYTFWVTHGFPFCVCLLFPTIRIHWWCSAPICSPLWACAVFTRSCQRRRLI